jgi:SNF2 family DNA or RNA helicase
MTYANNIVLFDLLWMDKDQRQAFARVHRYGQERETHLILMYSPGNPVERDIRARQRKRKNLGDMTWTVTSGDLEIQQLKENKQARRKTEKEHMMDTV